MSVKTNNPIVGERLLYFLVWAMALLVPILNSKMMSEEHVSLSNILLVWSKLLPYIIIFVINNSLLAPRYLFQRRYVAYFTFALVMLAAIFYPIEYYQDELRMIEYPDGSTYFVHGRASFTDLAWYWNVLLGLFMMGANCSIKFVFRSMQDEQKMVEMKRQALQAEMDYLKYQINPHFFMNTLNNIHAMIDIDSEAAKECVIELSKMMRYVLYDSEQVHTNLSQEVEFTENYVELMRIRYAADIDVQFNVQKPLPAGAKVPPLLFIVFVENAFKHGVSYNNPSFVHISLRCDDGKVICEVRNSRHKRLKTEKGGIGLENVRKRLELIFGRDYTLLIDESKPTEYSVKLTIPMYYDKVHNH
ncbi:MAG: histidine kinase [Alistipes sp.]|nr:histidine kinase [Alistipes sp.]